MSENEKTEDPAVAELQAVIDSAPSDDPRLRRALGIAKQNLKLRRRIGKLEATLRKAGVEIPPDKEEGS